MTSLEPSFLQLTWPFRYIYLDHLSLWKLGMCRSQALSDADLKIMSVDIPSGWDVETLGGTEACDLRPEKQSGKVAFLHKSLVLQVPFDIYICTCRCIVSYFSSIFLA